MKVFFISGSDTDVGKTYTASKLIQTLQNQGLKDFLPNVSKVEIVLNLIGEIRNHCFHWENLTKTRIIDNQIYPHTTTIYPKNQIKSHQTNIGIAPEMILIFLDNLINNINNQVMKKYQDIDISFRGI